MLSTSGAQYWRSGLTLSGIPPENATSATDLPLAGGTMSGQIDMGANKITNMGDGSAGTDAATMFNLVAYADTKVPKTGAVTLTGALDFNTTNKVTGIADGSGARDAVNVRQIQQGLLARTAWATGELVYTHLLKTGRTSSTIMNNNVITGGGGVAVTIFNASLLPFTPKLVNSTIMVDVSFEIDRTTKTGTTPNGFKVSITSMSQTMDFNNSIGGGGPDTTGASNRTARYTTYTGCFLTAALTATTVFVQVTPTAAGTPDNLILDVNNWMVRVTETKM